MGGDTLHIDTIFECAATSEVDWVIGTGTFTERLNAPYRCYVQLTTDNMSAEPVQLLGQSCSITIIRDKVQRVVPGIVTEVQEGSTTPQRVSVNIVVVPALEVCRHRINTRIFQEKTVPEILEEVLAEALGTFQRSVELKLNRTYPTCEYRVQYNESDFNFVSRLMEEEGIAYWFNFDGDTQGK